MSKTEVIKQHIYNDIDRITGIVTDGDYLWDEFDELVKYIDVLEKKAALYDRDKAKIRALDDIVATYENNTGLGECDEDLTDFEAIVDSIEHGIQMVGYRENEEETE